MRRNGFLWFGIVLTVISAVAKFFYRTEITNAGLESILPLVDVLFVAGIVMIAVGFVIMLVRSISRSASSAVSRAVRNAVNSMDTTSDKPAEVKYKTANKPHTEPVKTVQTVPKKVCSYCGSEAGGGENCKNCGAPLDLQ